MFGPERAVQNGPPRGPRRRVQVPEPLGQVLTPGDEIGRGNAPTVDEHAGHLGVEPVERSPQRDGHGAERDGLPEAVRVLAVRAGRRHELELGAREERRELLEMNRDENYGALDPLGPRARLAGIDRAAPGRERRHAFPFLVVRARAQLIDGQNVLRDRAEEPVQLFGVRRVEVLAEPTGGRCGREQYESHHL